MWCHPVLCVTIFVEINYHSSLWKMWLRQRTIKIGDAILLGLTPASIQWVCLKSHSQGIYNWRRVMQTHFLGVFFYLAWRHCRFRLLYFDHISCSLRWENILLHTLQQKTSESNLGVILPIMWHRLRVGPSDVYPTRKASFKDIQQGKPSAWVTGSCFRL